MVLLNNRGQMLGRKESIFNRKGQMESLGLVIIVILLVLIGVFVVYIMSSNRDHSAFNDYMTLSANNMRESVLKVEICEGVSVQDEMDACDKGYSLCGGCGDMEIGIRKILDAVIGKSKMHAIFQVSSTTDFEVSTGDCKNEYASAVQHLVSGAEIKLILCPF